MEHGSPTLNQINISRQQSLLSSVHQPIYCKETAATDMVSQYGVASQYRYNPETSNFLFPGMHPIHGNESNSTHFQLPSEVSKEFINQNLQNFLLSKSEHPPNKAMSIAKPGFLAGFQQTFRQKTATINPTAQPSHASSQLEFSEISRTNEISSHFSSAYPNFGDSTLTNRLSQYSETFVEIPTLSLQKAQYNPMNQTPQTNYIHRTESFPFAPLRCDINSRNPSTSGNNLCRNRESNIFNLYETGNPSYFTDHVSLPSTSQISVQNRESQVAKLRAIKFNEDKNKQCTDFSDGIAECAYYASSSIQTQQRNFGSGIINSNSEIRACEYSSPATYSSETDNARNISTTTTSNKSSVDGNEHTADKMLNKNSSVFKQNLDTPLGKPRRITYSCSKCPKLFYRKDYLESHERHHDEERPYVCHYCDRTFTLSFTLRNHIRTHTGETPYECMHCGKRFARISALNKHARVSHIADKTDP
ncbi:hypothetical protein CDAR_581111 [Caerostris darwini]|uniref:C2H2-type domain-containing protein n=1 Tax=Caerostris darwini TaxID=1538125 RepID=A0AAV4TTD3_9ARAC|nr:hypothetical protein CDAR_581111 [Caerostris darwini]